MQQLAEEILAIIGDYQNDHDVHLTSQNIIEWANQFDEDDREFVLSEFLHLLRGGIYVSKQKAKEQLQNSLEGIKNTYKYSTVLDFLRDTKFLNLQPAPKSQGELLILLEEILQQQHGISVANCGGLSPKNHLYFDDLLATGGTIFKTTNLWLTEQNNLGEQNYISVNKGSIRFIICVLCYHTWGFLTLRWLWKFNLNSDEIMKSIKMFYHYSIENQVGVPSEKLNLPLPVDQQPENVKEYFRLLDATKHEGKAFRKSNQPGTESFFTTPGNRLRFENILIQKGLTILNQVQTKNRAHRPLGATFPNYKTLGTGTMFFTWRNISNTCPLVFWWQGSWMEWSFSFKESWY